MNSKEYKKYKIDDYVYNELKWFCFQYNDKLRYVKIHPDVELSCKYIQDIDMIETALRLASDTATYEFLKKNVTQKNTPYEKLGAVPMGRRQFYEMRAKFFYILKSMKIG